MNVDDRTRLLALAHVATPEGRVLPAPGAETLQAVDNLLAAGGPTVQRGYWLLLKSLCLAAIPVAGKSLEQLELSERAAALATLAGGPGYWMVRAVTAPLKLARANHEQLRGALEVKATRLNMAREQKPWQQQILDGRRSEPNSVLEVDAVVVGTGAGGAPVAHRLAGDGHAVLMIEEGNYFDRRDFNSDPLSMQYKLYRNRGVQMALGNAMIPLPTGKAVGGSTTINSGTCFRIDEHVHRRWQSQLGLSQLGAGSLDAYYDKVERMLEVAPSSPSILGGVADVIARGCDALGYSHHILTRNAPGCDGQGVCCFGCPTDAKRSTNVSYVPSALKRGAMVLCNARVVEVLRQGRRAVGVVAESQDENGRTKRIEVRARTVVLSCGAIHTPALLLGLGLGNGSGQLGKNLTLHPACQSFAEFDESVRSWEAVPQGYGVDAFVSEGLRFEGGSLPPPYVAAFLGHTGPRWTQIMERFDRFAQFGFMVEDTGRGRVSLFRGRPQIRYRVSEIDRLKMIRGHAILARIYLAAGAKEVNPGLQYFDCIRDESDVARLERDGPSRLRPHHFDITAYHPLGTCRMGPQPGSSVVDQQHQVHDVDGLYVCDASTVAGPLGVNPQMTIMAMSERAGEWISRRLEGNCQQTVLRRERSKKTWLRFAESMVGECVFIDGQRGGESRSFRFKVDAHLPRHGAMATDVLRHKGGNWQLNGSLCWQGVASDVDCHGGLLMRPRGDDADLEYELCFEGDSGQRFMLRGSKKIHMSKLWRSATTLDVAIYHRDEECIVARGQLCFRLKSLPAFVRSWRMMGAATKTSLQALEL